MWTIPAIAPPFVATSITTIEFDTMFVISSPFYPPGLKLEQRLLVTPLEVVAIILFCVLFAYSAVK
jgi:hypothetical protein